MQSMWQRWVGEGRCTCLKKELSIGAPRDCPVGRHFLTRGGVQVTANVQGLSFSPQGTPNAPDGSNDVEILGLQLNLLFIVYEDVAHTESALKKAISKQPVSVAINTATVSHYFTYSSLYNILFHSSFAYPSLTQISDYFIIFYSILISYQSHPPTVLTISLNQSGSPFLRTIPLSHPSMSSIPSSWPTMFCS